MSASSSMPAPERAPLRRPPSDTSRSTSRTSARAARDALLRFALLSAGLAALIMIATVIIDPLQFYHRSFWHAPLFSNEQRYQNPGLARNYDYDTIIIGTSMTDNFRPSEVDRALGGRTLKLSIEGSTSDEHYKTASLALRTGRVKTVLWGLDYFSLKNGEPDTAGQFPDYLYDDIWWNDYKYWFNYSTYLEFAKSGARLVLGDAPPDIEYLYNWHGKSTFGKDRVLAAYAAAGAEEAYFGLNEESLDVVRRNFNDHILSLVEQYPSVRFVFYYPPYSILRHIVWADTNPTRFANQLEMKGWMFEQFSRFENVAVYDFQTESSWTYNLDLYKDLSHHTQDVNSRIAEEIGRDNPQYRVTADNAALFAERLRRQTALTVLGPQGDPVYTEVAVAGADGGTAEVKFSQLGVPGDDELAVPAKEAAAALGAALEWDQAAATLRLTRGGATLVMQPDSRTAMVGGAEVNVPHPARLQGGTLMVPFAFAAEQLGWQVRLERPEYAARQFVVTDAGSGT